MGYVSGHTRREMFRRKGSRMTASTRTGVAFNLNQLLREVWGPNRADTRSLRVFITTLRKKLEQDPTRPTHILTEPGIGYRLVVRPQD